MSESGVLGRERLQLSEGWELTGTPPGACGGPEALDGRAWLPAQVPGTVAGALGEVAAGRDLDDDDWWFRLRFDGDPAGDGEEVVLQLGGLATIAEAYLNGSLVLESESMFAAHEIDVGDRLRASNELAICCRALAPRLRERRKPRARWRTKLVAGNLRFYRTMLLGRAPGFAPGPAAVGPWRPVYLLRRRGVVLDDMRLRPRVRGVDGVLECQARVRALPGAQLPERLAVTVESSGASVVGELAVAPETGRASGSVSVPQAELWWPHTHGRPALYSVSVTTGKVTLHRARIGFRRLRTSPDLELDGPTLSINDVPVFARGAVWTPLDLRRPDAAEPELRRVLESVAACGMNMLRVAGIGAYESGTFYDLCDELGILVWQDFMFANLDYPEQDELFMGAVEAEARQLLDGLGGRPCLAVLCGNSEVAQQVAMLGLDPALASGPLYGGLLPRLVAEAELQAPYIPSAPWGGELPFRTDRGVANYYGVGAYLRPLEDVRRAEVRFAAECLAFANVPDESALSALSAPGGLTANHPAWKAGVPRDAGAGWDFDDVRDHYLKLLFAVDPVALRSIDPDRYLELSRAVSGEVMAEVLGEWRRAGSPCGGALVLWLKDLAPGAGWGVLDHRGEPKVVYHHLRRALAPVAVWSTDEGLGGIVAHIANDRPEPLTARLRVALYRDFGTRVGEAVEDLALDPHSYLQRSVETVLGRFVDAAWAYRFGPPAQDLIAISLEHERDGVTESLSQSFRFPAGRPLAPLAPEQLGLRAWVQERPAGGHALHVASTRFAYGVRAAIPGHVTGDDAFGVEPGHQRLIPLVAVALPADGGVAAGGLLSALNMSGPVKIQMPE